MQGLMMDVPLTITSIMRHADTCHRDAEIVSVTAEHPRHRYNFGAAFSRVRRLANALAAYGMQSGDRVGTLAWNDYRHFEIYYAVSCAGCVTHTINPRLFYQQIRYIINHAQDRLLFVDPHFVPIIEQISGDLSSVEAVVILADESHMPDTALDKVHCYETFIQDQPEVFAWPDLDENTASNLCYTSGTTGNPKGVLYSHRSNVLHSYAIVMPDATATSARDVILPLVPMYHVNAWGVPFAAPLVGSKLVLPGPRMGDSATIHALISEEGVTFSLGVPTIWMTLLNYLEQHGATLDSLRRIIIGGASCPQWMIERFEHQYGVEVRHSWGMTEMSPVGTVNTLKSGMDKLPAADLNRIKLKAGRPLYGVEIKIVDDSNNELPWDGATPGLLKVRGPWICREYFRPQAPDSTHGQDGWMSTGDVVTIDKDGFIQVTDRAKDVIKSGGEWISSIGLENAAAGHPGVAEAAVIGIPHPKWQERPLLIVVKKPGQQLTGDELLEWLKERVAKWWLPDEVVFIDAIPHTATGKIHKTVLREQFKDYKLKES
jgi:fatty-acyl-CoA synthase